MDLTLFRQKPSRHRAGKVDVELKRLERLPRGLPRANLTQLDVPRSAVLSFGDHRPEHDAANMLFARNRGAAVIPNC